MVQNCKEPKGSSTGEWPNKFGYSHTIHYYSAIKNSRPPMHTVIWMNLKIIILRKKARPLHQKTLYYSISLMWNSREHQLTYNDRKENISCLGKKLERQEGADGRIIKEHLETWGRGIMDMFIILTVMMVHRYVYMSKFIQLYSINMYDLLYLNF